MKSPTKHSPHKTKPHPNHQFVCSPLQRRLKQNVVYKRKRLNEEDNGSDVSAKPTLKGAMKTKKKRNKAPDIISLMCPQIQTNEESVRAKLCIRRRLRILALLAPQMKGIADQAIVTPRRKHQDFTAAIYMVRDRTYAGWFSLMNTWSRCV